MNSALALVIARGWANVCAAATFLIVAQFLSPADFGVFALCSSASMLPILLIGAGVYEHVLGRDPRGETEPTAQTLGFLTGVAAAMVILGFAAVSQFVFDSAEGAIILSAFAMSALIWGVAVMREAAAIRDGRGFRVTIASFIGETVGLGVLVLAFSLNAGIYALVIGRLTSQVLYAASVVLASGALPRWAWRGEHVSATARFAGSVAGGRVVGWGFVYYADLALGWAMSPAAVGVFRMGYRIFLAAASVITSAPSPAILAIIGDAVAKSPQAAQRATLKATELSLVLTTPIYVLLATMGGLAVATLLKPEWDVAGAVITALCLTAPLSTACNVLINRYMAQGRSKDLLLQNLVTHAPLLIVIAALAQNGAVVVGLVLSAHRVLIFATLLAFARELTARGKLALLRSLAANLAAGGAMAIVSGLGMALVSLLDNMVVKLAAASGLALVALLVFALAVRLVSPKVWRLLRAMLKVTLRRRQGRAAPPADIAAKDAQSRAAPGQ